MKGFKAFEPGLICKGKQYEENAIATEEKAIPCDCGLHFCKNPFDVLDYYPLITENGKFSEFAEVEALDEPVTNDKKKYCTTKLKVGAKLSFEGFVRACIDFVFVRTVKSMPDNSHGYSAKIGSSGNSAKIGSSGDYAKIDSSGEDSVIMCAGFNSRAKAKKGSWITLAEWKYDEDKERWAPDCVKTEQVDGERIKEDTFYQLIDGEFKEVE
nr:MAG TPA: hypothetical protein [Caudoviricetes sp.]